MHGRPLLMGHASSLLILIRYEYIHIYINNTVQLLKDAQLKHFLQ